MNAGVERQRDIVFVAESKVRVWSRAEHLTPSEQAIEVRAVSDAGRIGGDR